MIREVSGSLTLPSDSQVAVVASRYNEMITGALKEKAIQTLLKAGAKEKNIEIYTVPGAFELPLAVKWALSTGRFQGVIALGAVIRGGTPHFEYVCQETSRGLAQLSLKFSIPVGFGLLTCDTVDQAMERSGGAIGNKGEEAALAVIEMINLSTQYEQISQQEID